MTGAAVLAALFAMAGTASSADEPRHDQQSQTGAQTSSQGGQAQAEGGERQFMMKAAQGGMLEVEASKLAMERASSQEVKDFAKMIHEDHTAANRKLKEIAQTNGVQLPTELDAKHKQELARLQKLQGQAFEQAYMQRMGVQDHKKDIQAFEKQAQTSKDDQLKNFAQETLPTLRKHLTRAQEITGSASAQSSGGADSQNGQQ